jgi:hypothetical protein
VAYYLSGAANMSHSGCITSLNLYRLQCMKVRKQNDPVLSPTSFSIQLSLSEGGIPIHGHILNTNTFLGAVSASEGVSPQIISVVGTVSAPEGVSPNQLSTPETVSAPAEANQQALSAAVPHNSHLQNAAYAASAHKHSLSNPNLHKAMPTAKARSRCKVSFFTANTYWS